MGLMHQDFQTMEGLGYTVRYGGRKKTIALTVLPDGAVTVFAPRFVTKRFIHRFVEKKTNWIQKRRRHLAQVQKTRRPLEFLTGVALTHFGKPLRLTVHEGTVPVPLVHRHGNRLHVTVAPSNEDCRVVHHSPRVQIKSALKSWFTEETARALLPPLTFFKKRLKVSPGRVTVASHAKRWGSCSRKGQLRFNWKLSMMPRPVFDYVVVHELCHLKELNHSRQFWGLVESFLPDYKDRRRWLKTNGGDVWNVNRE